MTELLINIAVSIVIGVIMTLASYRFFQILQLNSYKVRGVFGWLKATKAEHLVRLFAFFFLATTGMIVFINCFDFQYYNLIGLVFLFAFGIMFFYYTSTHQKTPLKMTPRIIRLYNVVFVLMSLVGFGLLQLKIPFIGYAIIGGVVIVSPLVVLVGYYITYPLEKIISNYYVSKARKKLASADLINIGVTGSYGKTTFKNILAAILSSKYKVLATPASYNTPLGIARTVNNVNLGNYNIFIAEMGARRVGDIGELTRLVRPNIAVITAIGEQHLESFVTRDNIIATKYEIASSDSVELLVSDSDNVPYEDSKCNHLQTGSSTELLVHYEKVQATYKGTIFDINIKGEVVHIETPLLGAHIPSVITMCASVASHLGLDAATIKSACASLVPIPHRLELIDKGDNIIIDDAYNSNPSGAKNALDILATVSGRTKIVITPGMIELGEQEHELNKQLGSSIGDTCDIAILVGSRAEAIRQGIGDKIPPDKIFTVASLQEAMKIIATIDGRKAILFENDLPDNIK